MWHSIRFLNFPDNLWGLYSLGSVPVRARISTALRNKERSRPLISQRLTSLRNLFVNCALIFRVALLKIRRPGKRRDGRVVEGARLESVYTSKGYRGFESRFFRTIIIKHTIGQHLWEIAETAQLFGTKTVDNNKL